ncbi:hypothetical protein H4Q26_016494 [Puccinia striiformis f. sp. tritici PST-130]|nr:hypothetical protein H4Q26_016494 [Puccinia striiformis f. sp. tritici PST-130]
MIPPNYMMNSWLMFESQLVTLYGDPNELRATEYKLDSLTMKDGDHASNYISILDLLAQNTEVFDTLSDLIEATLKIDTRHHKRQKEKKRENGSQPLQPKKDTSKTTSSSTPSTSRNPSTSKSTSKTPSEITKVLEGGRLMANEKERRAKAGSYFEQWKNNCVETPSAIDPIDPFTSSSKICLLQTKSSNQLRFILFHNNSPYSVLLDSGATRSFIKPMQWLSKKTLWTFKISSFPIFLWECLVIDATGIDDAILGYDFLTHWNPDINWSEGLIIPCALPPAAPIKLLSSSSSQEPVSLRSLIAMSSNGSLPDDLHPPGNSSTFIPSVVYLALQDESYDFKTEEVLIRSITTGSRQEVFEGDFFDDPPADLETILPTIPSEYHEFASLFSTILADQLPPRRACDHRIDLLGPVPKKDALTRREDVYPKAGEAFADKNPGNVRQLFKTNDRGSVSLLAVSTGDVEDSLNNFRQSQLRDSKLANIIEDCKKGRDRKKFSLDEKTSLLLFDERIYSFHSSNPSKPKP